MHTDLVGVASLVLETLLLFKFDQFSISDHGLYIAHGGQKLKLN